MSQPFFEIKDLRLSYNSSDSVVFTLKNLIIPQGKIVFLLGSSGTGKSTLLESLGLMNNTLSSGDIIFYPGSSQSFSYNELWRSSDKGQLSKLRKDHFSFIFQNTNLMENFTAYENVCLSRMIQNDHSLADVTNGALPLMERMGLPISEVNEEKMAYNLSGGQRQRLAFVRALNTDFKILFGDEPTGNLDGANADLLMTSIKEAIGEKRSAVIVSHDIDLALKHADIIYCLSKNGNMGEILPENMFQKEIWHQLEGRNFENFRKKIEEFYKTGEVPAAPQASKIANFNKNGSFRSLFWKNEGKALRGKGYINLGILSLIFFITLLALGFTNGSIKFLEEKSKDPFVNWITVDVKGSQTREFVDQLRTTLSTNPEIKSRYFINTATSFNTQPMWFWANGKSEPVRVRGRSIEFEGNLLDPILGTILRAENIVNGKSEGFRDEKNSSIIVTESILNELGGDSKSGFVNLAFNCPSTDSSGAMKYNIIPVPIYAIVKSLPGKMDIAYSRGFLKSWLDLYGPFNPAVNKSFYIHFSGNDKEETMKLKEALANFCKNYTHKNPELISMEPYLDSWLGGFVFNINFSESTDDLSFYSDFYNSILTFRGVEPFKSRLKRIYNLNEIEAKKMDRNYDMLSISFLKTDSIRGFQKYLMDFDKEGGRENAFEIDISQVMEKENFTIISNILFITAIILMIFSLISVSVFISNLLKMHLEKIKMNIGTFIAFGLERRRVITIYLSLILWFLLKALFIGLLVSYLFGLQANILLSRYFILSKNIKLFSLFEPYTYLTIGLIAIAASSLSLFTIRKLLLKTPGDLIYNR